MVAYNAMKVYKEMGLADEVYSFARDLAGGPSDIWFDFMFGDGRNGALNPICTVRASPIIPQCVPIVYTQCTYVDQGSCR